MFSKVENKSQWKGLLDSALFKTFFHSPGWEEFLENEFKWIKFEHYVWCPFGTSPAGRKDEALLSMARCRLFGKEKLVSHPFCEYGGPLPLKEKFDFENFIGDFRSAFGFSARIRFHPYLYRNSEVQYCFPAHSRPASAGLEGSGCFGSPCGRSAEGRQTSPSRLQQGENPPESNIELPNRFISTFWIENFSQRSPEDLLKSFRKTLRHEIKKAEGSGMEVSECENEEDLKEFYGQYLQTVKRHKNIPLPFSAFRFFCGSMLTGSDPVNSSSKIFLAKTGNKVVGGSVFLFYPPFIHYFINASDIRFREYNANHLILWKAIQKYSGSGFDYFDLGGTRKGSGLEIFKRGWGAKEFPIYEVGGSGKESKGDKSMLRSIWGMLPISISSRLSHFMLWMKV